MKYVKIAVACVVVISIANLVMKLSDPKIAVARQEKERAAQQEKVAQQQAQVDGWNRWYEEAKAKNASAKKEQADPNWKDGFEVGYTAGFMLARGGSSKPNSQKLDGMARTAATSRKLEESERLLFTTGYGAGFSYGWSKGK